MNHSKARTKSGKTSLDYTIEITPQLLKVVQQKQNDLTVSTKIEKADELEIDPIKMSGIGFNPFKESDKAQYQYRTGLFTLPKNHIVVGIQLKIVESNPAKVGAEKILTIFNEYKDEAKTIINNYLPKSESPDNTPSGNKDDNTETVGNK